MTRSHDLQDMLRRAEHVINETRALRQLQKAYFRERGTTLLQQCKIQERKLDQLIDKYFDPQKELF